MKRLAFLGMLFLPSLVFAVNEDNRPVGTMDMRNHRKQADRYYYIEFSTTIVANTDTVILGDLSGVLGTTQPLAWPSGINFSTSPNKTNGGRSWATFQFVQGQSGAQLPQNEIQRVYVGLGSTVSSSTGTYITVGEWWPARDGWFVWQGSVTVRSTSTAIISGYIITEKSRR